MSEENRKWLERLIKENKESPNELTYTYCPFEVLYQLQKENKKQKKIIEKAKAKMDSIFANGDNEKILEDLLKLNNILEDKEV